MLREDRNQESVGRSPIKSRASGAWLGLTIAGLFIVSFAGSASATGSVWLPGVGGINNVSVETVQERKFQQVVRQEYDFSCGSAALATLLTFHYEDSTTEQQAFGVMYDNGDQAKIRAAGFSLLDMKQYLEENGYQADGYQATLATLASVGVPAIALINVRGYRHFVVVKGLENEEVLVGDPALGLRFVPAGQFVDMWENGILFIIRNKSETGKRHFNVDKEWRLLARAPMGAALNQRSLESVTFSSPRLLDIPLD